MKNNTECIRKQVRLQVLGRRKVVGEFEGGTITSDAGGILLREIESARSYISDFESCFVDYRNQKYVEHPLGDLLSQRIFGICLGYEDINDHDELRKDPLFATICNKEDPEGENRENKKDRGIPLASRSTLNRIEYTEDGLEEPTRYRKIFYNEEKVQQFFVSKFIESRGEENPEFLILDIDATDDPVHGHQQGRFFHGYYDNYCYLPLYIFCDNDLLCARLKTANLDPGNEALSDIKRVVLQLKEKWPDVKILIRGDSGFCRNQIMEWCEEQEGVFYLFGLARNTRLYKRITREMKEAKVEYNEKHKPCRKYKDFKYKTLSSWSKKRRVIGKAEYGSKGENPRFIVTNLKEYEARQLYEELYCARGEMENRIKEQQLYLFADRTSCSMLAANRLRLYFACVAYMLMNELRKTGLAGTELETAQCSTIRLKVFKIGAIIKISVRRVYINLSSAYPYKDIFYQIIKNLSKNYPMLN